MSEKRTPEIQSLKRAISILKTFTVDEAEIGVGALGRRLQLPKSTVYRLLSTMESEGLIGQNPDTGKYRLGLELLSLAGNVLVHIELQNRARPHLRRLSNTLNETVNLSILDRNFTVNIEQFVSADRLVMRVGWVGRRMPNHAVSAGKVIVAFSSDEAQEDYLEGEHEALTPNTKTDREALREELSNIREQGYATAFEELEQGLHAVSAPICNHEGYAIASVSVSGPAYRLTKQRLNEIAPQVVEAALQVSREMGYRGNVL
jgi:DNA-binding IclR family transcriptional regulator